MTLHKKVLVALLAIALIPLGVLALYSGSSLNGMANYLRGNATAALDRQAAQSLEIRAETLARGISDFLYGIEGDLKDLALVPPNPERYRAFSRNHRRQIWFRTGTNQEPRETRQDFPLYHELAFVGGDGRERVRLVDEVPAALLRDLSDPANTTYGNEDYFQKAKGLAPGRIYVSHVTGWHVNKAAQLQGAANPETAVEGARFAGVVRFAMPVRGASGQLQGVVVLSLDHRHLMEFTLHLTPTEDRYVLFPSYDSGNYGFMFDDEGWMIAHPKYWDIRGLDPSGKLLEPYSPQSSPAAVAAGDIPFNLFAAGFIHANYPEVAKAVVGGRSGVVDVTNIGGAQKIMAYAPIFYDSGDYAKTGVFGGVTIGAQVDQFHKPAQQAAAVIRQDLIRFIGESSIMIVLAGCLALFAAYRLSTRITAPLLQLIEGTKEMARGNLSTRVVVSSHDEVGALADAFNVMALELNDRSARLLKTLDDLKRSRKEILRERNFKETVFENIETGILTLNGKWRVTSVNGPATRILQLPLLGNKGELGDLLAGWPDLLGALKEAREEKKDLGRWSRYVTMAEGNGVLTFRLALLPLTHGEKGGRILTVEDLTERVNLRRRMERMERLVSLGRLSAGIAHEIRNPLTGISLLLDELHDRLLHQPTDQGLIRRSLQEIERLEGLVNELLNFASLPQSTLEPGEIGTVLRDTLFLFKKQCQKGGVALVEDLDPSFPSIPMDSGKLKQAFLNLLANALEAMPGGGALTVAAHLENGSIKVLVTDSGEGIPEERIPFIFEPFFTSKGEGTGLGLSITHNIISDHGGRIEVDSLPGAGTTFTIYFPVLPDPVPPAPTDPALS